MGTSTLPIVFSSPGPCDSAYAVTTQLGVLTDSAVSHSGTRLPKTCQLTLMSNDLSAFTTRLGAPTLGCSVVVTMPVKSPSMEGAAGLAGSAGRLGSKRSVMSTFLPRRWAGPVVRTARGGDYKC